MSVSQSRSDPHPPICPIIFVWAPLTVPSPTSFAFLPPLHHALFLSVVQLRVRTHFYLASPLAGNSLRFPPSLPSHSWAHVIIGMWHKYPNPHCSHVVTVDVVDRSVDPSTGIIRTERVLGCKQRTPTWIVRVRPFHSRYHDQQVHASHIAIRWFRGCVRS